MLGGQHHPAWLAIARFAYFRMELCREVTQENPIQNPGLAPAWVPRSDGLEAALERPG